MIKQTELQVIMAKNKTRYCDIFTILQLPEHLHNTEVTLKIYDTVH